MMTTTLANFTSETQLTTSESTMTSTQDGVSATAQEKYIGMATVTNTSSDNAWVTVWRLATETTGTTGSGGNWIWRKQIAANSTESIESIIGHVLSSGMKISALADTSGVINVDISGTVS